MKVHQDKYTKYLDLFELDKNGTELSEMKVGQRYLGYSGDIYVITEQTPGITECHVYGNRKTLYTFSSNSKGYPLVPKTDIVKEIAEKNGFTVLDIQCGEVEPKDIRGLPTVE